MLEKTNVLKARKLCNEVKILCKKYNMNFFFVTDGASCTSNNGNPAIKTCRDGLADWEETNGFNSKEDWGDNPGDLSEYSK